jgi:hypothetical protein
VVEPGPPGASRRLRRHCAGSQSSLEWGWAFGRGPDDVVVRPAWDLLGNPMAVDLGIEVAGQGTDLAVLGTVVMVG